MALAQTTANGLSVSAEPFGGLRARIIALVIIVLIIPVSVAAFMLDKHGRDQTRFVEVGLRAAAHDLARDQGMLIAQASYLLSTLSIRQDSWLVGEGCSDNLESIAGGAMWSIGIAVASPDGLVLCGSRASMHNTSLADRAYFQESVAQKRFVVSDLVVARGGVDAPTLIAAQPVLDAAGKVRLMLLAALRVDGFVRLTEQGRIGHGFDLALMFDRRGVLVAQHPPRLGAIGMDYRSDPLVAAMLDSPGGIIRAESPDGIRRLHGFAVIPDTGGIIVVARDEKAVQAPVRDEALTTFGILSLATLFAGAIAWWFARVVVLRGILEISSAAHEGRDISALPLSPGSATEVGQLHRALLQHETRRSSAERRWHALGVAGAQVIWRASAVGRLLEVRGWQGLMGEHAASAHPMHILGAVHRADRRQLLRVWRASLSESEPFSLDIRVSTGGSENTEVQGTGVWRWMRVRGVPVTDTAGSVNEWIGTLVDIHEARQAELALQDREARFRSVLETAADSVIVVDDRGRISEANPAAEMTFGWSRAELLGESLGRIMPAGMAVRHDDYVTAHAGSGGSRILGMQRELDGLRRDGTTFPLEIAVTQWQDGDGRAWYTGIMRDISARRNASQALAESEGRFRLLAEKSGDVVALCDLDGTRRYVSPMSKSVLGWEPEELTGQRGMDFVHANDLPLLLEAHAALQDGCHESSVIYRHLRPDGSWTWVEGHARRDSTVQGANSERYVVVLRDATARVIAEKKMQATLANTERMASTDGLTGLANRRQFDMALASAWQRSKGARQPLSVLLLDVDRFKLFNDRYGHLAGDGCLRALGGAIASVAGRPDDVAARYGGEEFVLLLPNTDAGGALYLAQKLRYEIETRAIPHVDNAPTGIVTASIGVATERFNGIDVEFADATRLIEAADGALYQAKHGGRNRVVLARAEETRPDIAGPVQSVAMPV